MPKVEAGRVVWNEDETQQVLSEAVRIGRMSPGRALGGLLNDAVAILPAHRQRHFGGYKAFRRWDELVRALQTTPEPPPAAEPIIVNIVKPDATRSLHDAKIEDLVVELVRRFQRESPLLLGNVIAERFESLSVGLNVRSSAAVPAPSNQRRKRIVVIGLKADQYRHVLDRVSVPPARFEVVFHDKEKHQPTPPCEFCIVQRHSSHTHWDQAQKNSGSIVFVDGGVNAVAEEIRKFIEL